MKLIKTQHVNNNAQYGQANGEAEYESASINGCIKLIPFQVSPGCFEK